MCDATLKVIMLFRGYKYGFTLLELLVVISIIGLLAAVVLASTNDSREEALKARTLSELRSVYTAMEILRLESGLYPHGEEDYCPPQSASGNEIDLSDPAVGLNSSILTDPWGNPYFFDGDYYCTPNALGCNGFESNSSSDILAVLVSCGPDGMIGNDTNFSQPNNGIACAYNDDNVVLQLCS